MSKSGPYTIEMHRHRVAAWAASRGASTSPLCRFRVETGVAILEAAGFSSDLAHPRQLPISDELDKTHSKWRKRAIRVASDKGLGFSHGIAAKLINIYLKVRFVCAGHHKHDNAKNLHPPIDALLLKTLGDENVGGFSSDWRRFHNMRWSKFSSEEYEAVIDLIRRAIPGRPLWMIEQYWQGHQ